MATAKADAADVEKDEKAQRLPFLEDGELATVVRVELKTRKTRAPKPYTEGTLLDDMKGAAKFVEDATLRKAIRTKEASGIGTAATRAETIEKLKAVKYIKASGKTITATPKGLDFITWLESIMPELTDVALTARWQAELDGVAVSGGGKAFEAGVADNVRQLVSIFQVAPSMRLASTSSTEGSSSMTDTPKRANKPSDKMLEFAKRIADKVGKKVPDDVMADWDACKAFIDENKDAAMRPSEKQIAFAGRIAKEKGLTVPDDALKDGRELSRWIDENISK
ncbi:MULTISPECIES: DNA topoisomerase [unclassified Variovorax]|uniref:DNA topoisomerase n=1 Tax=unclassified Variovorax TaxID=663243 RepID=UPI00076CCA90|nr:MULTISPECIES: DNA topoisomerase [unclassified Variovorax]KWT98319.1 DNA topoisomerase III [Variovorax sp. WDL1]PNG50026.1 DNA topoisomerase 3 [Variovorax sp. B2]PNG50898.1 DNA topoisomerase 3 [Variovorax sp. B4]VTU41517.1 DNA topoisomerase 3 [Variovorax sp. SRS16]VTU41542.1 DNA topoisomerase 3 [Variovorax sp. PBL-E5]